jgi:hypothetical protein
VDAWRRHVSPEEGIRYYSLLASWWTGSITVAQSAVGFLVSACPTMSCGGKDLEESPGRRYFSVDNEANYGLIFLREALGWRSNVGHLEEMSSRTCLLKEMFEKREVPTGSHHMQPPVLTLQGSRSRARGGRAEVQ